MFHSFHINFVLVIVNGLYRVLMFAQSFHTAMRENNTKQKDVTGDLGGST